MPAWFTVIASGMITVAPQLLPLLPQSAKAVLTGVLAISAAAFHLYSPVPEISLGHTA